MNDRDRQTHRRTCAWNEKYPTAYCPCCGKKMGPNHEDEGSPTYCCDNDGQCADADNPNGFKIWYWLATTDGEHDRDKIWELEEYE